MGGGYQRHYLIVELRIVQMMEHTVNRCAKLNLYAKTGLLSMGEGSDILKLDNYKG